MVAQTRNLLTQPQHSILLQEGTIRCAHAGRKRAAMAPWRGDLDNVELGLRDPRWPLWTAARLLIPLSAQLTVSEASSASRQCYYPSSSVVLLPQNILCFMMQFRTMSSGDVPVDIALAGVERRCEYRGGPNWRGWVAEDPVF